MELMFKNIAAFQKALGVGYLELFFFIVCVSFLGFLYKYFSEQLKEKDIAKKEKEREQLTLLIQIQNLIMKNATDDEIITTCQNTIGVGNPEVECYSFQLMDRSKELDREHLLSIVRNDLIKIRNLNMNPNSIMRDVNNVLSYVRPLLVPILPSFMLFYLTLLSIYPIVFILKGKWNWIIVVLGVLIVLCVLNLLLYIGTKVLKLKE